MAAPKITYKQITEGESSYRFYVDGRLRGFVNSGVGGRWDACSSARLVHANHCWTREDAARSIIQQQERKAEVAAARRRKQPDERR